MESIYFTEEHVALRDQVARFLAREVEPNGNAWEDQGHVPREVLRKMGELGFFGITYPAEYGGSEADALTSLVYAEALSRSTFGGFVVTALVHSDMASPHLVHGGSKAQLDKYLPGIIRGDLITAVAVTEPDAGSDVAGIRTRARRDGADWVLNGAKMFITNGVLADLYFVAARTDAADGRLHFAVRNYSDALSWFLVGIENANAANHRAESAGQRNRRDVAIGAGGRAADNRGSWRGTKRHRGVLSLTLRNLVHQYHNLARIMRLLRFQ